jgi:hypothetical protein
LSKDGQHDYAASVMTQAAREFEDLGEAEDWSVAQQKLALAHGGAGNLAEAQRLIGIACDSGTAETPMQKVRLSTAQRCGLSHQLRAIQAIRQDTLSEAT